MSEMIERVARVLAADIELGFPRFTEQRWEWLTELARQTMRQRARVAIEAMREPTEAMIEAGVSADTGKTLGDRVSNCHRAMIDKALE